jgi:thioredoxin-related protein
MYRLLLIALISVMASPGWSAETNAHTRNALEQSRVSGQTPLMDAVRAGDVRRVSALLESGVDVNDRNAGGMTALMLAAAEGRIDLVELLLEAGARPDVVDYQAKSVPDRAAENGHDRLARMLRARIAEVDKVGRSLGYDFADDAYVDVSHPAWFKQSFLDLREDLEDALVAGKQGIMLFISSRRCSYCKAFLDRALSDPEIKRRVQAGFDVIGLDIFSDLEMVDVDGRSYHVNQFVTKVKAAYTPTLIFYGAGGQRLLRIVGYYPPEKFERVLDYLEGRHYREEPLRSYLARNEPDSSGGPFDHLVDRELFRRPPYILDRRAADGQRPLLVVFERGKCEACVRLHRRVLADDAIRELIGHFEAVQLDISDASERLITPAGERITAKQWYEHLDLSYSPAIVFFDESGTEVMRLDSETLRYRMEGSLQLVLDKGYRDDAQLQRWRRAQAIEASSRQ